MSVLPTQTQPRQIRFADLESQVLFVFSAAALLAISCANQVHIETNDHVKMFPRLELLARLSATGFGGLIGIYGLLFIERVRNAFLTFPAIWILGIWVLLFLGSVFSPNPEIAFPHLCTFTSVALFAPTAFAVMGTRLTIFLIFGSLQLTLVASWFLYFALPEYGVIIEITDAAGNYVERMGGVSHPNYLASSSVLCLVIILFLTIERKMQIWITVPATTLCLATLVMTGTRVAVLAFLVSVCVVYRKWLFRRDVFPLAMVVGCFVVAAAMMILSEDSGGMASRSALKSVTRSGTLDEITSVTGRDKIWAFTLDRIAERPLLGWGPGVAKKLLGEQDMLLHTHNVVLHIGLAGGVLGALCVSMLLIHQFFSSLGSRYPLAALISFLILITSVTENPIFDYVPGTSTVLFLIAVFWPSLDDGSL